MGPSHSSHTPAPPFPRSPPYLRAAPPGVRSNTGPAAPSATLLRPISEEHANYIVQRGVDIYYKMLLEDNLMHADMHPGNLLFSFLEDTREANRVRIGLVDLGLVAVLTDDEAANFIGFLRAVGDGDGGSAADCVLRWRVGPGGDAHGSELAELSFRKAVIASFAKVCRGYGTNIQLGEVLQTVLTHLREHQISIGANYATLVINALCLEGMARALVPSYNVMDGARMLLTAHGVLTRRVRHAPLRQWIIRRALPVARLIKRVHDRSVLRKIRKAASQEPKGSSV